MKRTMSARAKALRQAPQVSVSAGTPGVGDPPPSAALSASAVEGGHSLISVILNIRLLGQGED